jgi:hypothetical protein
MNCDLVTEPSTPVKPRDEVVIPTLLCVPLERSGDGSARFLRKLILRHAAVAR